MEGCYAGRPPGLYLTSIFTNKLYKPLWLAWLHLWMSRMMQGFASMAYPFGQSKIAWSEMHTLSQMRQSLARMTVVA